MGPDCKPYGKGREPLIRRCSKPAAGIFLLLMGIGWPGFLTAETPAIKKPGLTAAPPIETKVRQVPGEGSYSVPLWKQHWELARKAVLQKEYQRAVAAYKQALSLKPSLDEARLELVRVLETIQRYEEATAELEIFIEHQPHNLKVQQEMGDLLALRREYRRAADWYQRLLQRDPENLAARLSLAGVYSQLNETEKAMIEWRQVLIRDPQQVEARLNLAEGLKATRRYDEAILLLEGLVRQFPKQTSLKKKWAQALMAAHRGKEALPVLQELARQDPADLDVQLQLAQVLAAGKQYEQSLPILETYLKKKPENTGALLEKARILMNKGKTSEAFATYEQLKKLEPDNRELQREVAEAYYAQGRSAEALAGFLALRPQLPQDQQLLEKLGNLFLQKKDYKQAIQAYEEALAVDPNDVYVQLGLARAYNLSGNKEKAVPFYQSLLKKRDNQEIKLELAGLFIEMGQTADAFQIYEDLLGENPDWWQVRYRWATALYRQKDYARASVQLKTLIQDQPQNMGVWTLMGYNAMNWGDWRDAQKAFQRVLVGGEDRGNILIRLAALSRMLGRPQKALNYLEWAQTLKPEDQEIPVQRVLALTDFGNLAQARRILEPLLEAPQLSFSVQRARALLLKALDRDEEFLQLSRQLEQGFPEERTRIFLDRASFYADRGEPALEMALLRAAQEGSPQDLEVRKRIGASRFQEKNWTEAENLYLKLFREKNLLEEAALRLGRIKMVQGRTEEAAEYFWRALAEDPDSVSGRYWLRRLETRSLGTRISRQVEQNLLEFARTQESGLLELGDLFASENQWDRALELYREAVETGEDDELIQAGLRIAHHLLNRKEVERALLFLEDFQKRVPRNQKITRELIRAYGLNKSYEEAIRNTDALLKQEDPLDPVLNRRKARFLEKWNKHGASQDTFAILLNPAVDQVFWEKVQAGPWMPRLMENEPLKALIEQRDPGSLYSFYDAFALEMKKQPLPPEIRRDLEALVLSLEAKALIQKKVYLEMEGKDRIWRGQLQESRVYLEELKEIDPKNEDVRLDLERSYRLLQ